MWHPLTRVLAGAAVAARCRAVPVAAACALQVYDKSRISTIKHRSVRREARIMRFLTEKG